MSKSIKLIFFTLMVLMIAAAACAPGNLAPEATQAETQTPPAGAPTRPGLEETPERVPTEIPPTPFENEILPPAAVLMAQQVLAQRLNVSTAEIQILEIEQEQFPDACLGAAEPGEMCAQVITDGFRVVFAVDGKTYEYHTNMNGSQIRAVESPALPAGEQGALPTAVMAARQALARELGVRIMAVRIVSHEMVDWPDACLGVPSGSDPCAQVITPGYRVSLDYDGQTYEYHTNADGSQVVEAQAGLSIEGDVVLAWRREGGFAGFCDDMLIYADGRAVATSCRSSNPAKDQAGFLLTDEQMRQVNEWAGQFESFELREEDHPGAADSMTIQLALVGRGSRQATEADQDAIALFAQEIYTNAPR